MYSTSRNHKGLGAAMAAPQPSNSASKSEVSQHSHAGFVKRSSFISPRIGFITPRGVLQTRMPMAVYSSNHSTMSNRSAPRSHNTPSVRSQATMAPAPPPEEYADDVNYSVPGWPVLAKVIAKKPDLEAFPTFTDLSIKSLLYYQAELIYLRKRLHKAEWKDHRQPEDDEDDKCLYAEDLHLFILARDQAIDHNEKVPEQWELIEKIRTTLEKYNAALLQFSEVASLREADNCNIKTLRDCVRDCRSGGLMGDGSRTWGNPSEGQAKPKALPELFWGLFKGFFVSPDPERQAIPAVFQEHLIVPRKGKQPDGLTKWVTSSFIPFYDYLRKHYAVPFWQNYPLPIWVLILRIWHFLAFLWLKLFPEKQPRTDLEKRDSDASNPPLSPTLTNNSSSSENSLLESLTVYSGPWIVRITSILTTVVACLLPTVAITVLARVHSMGLILGLIALFTAIFAVGLVLLSSSSSRVEIFTATAAFSAVMVVFVQNQIGPQ